MAGYLISRSALVDTTATLTLAIVGVRFFAVVRAVGRYLERYVGHLGTFRMLTRTRVWFFAGIEPLAPAALDEERRGDVLTRIVDDVETLQDLPLRVLVPPIAAVLAGAVGLGVLGALDPLLAVVLLGFLLVCRGGPAAGVTAHRSGPGRRTWPPTGPSPTRWRWRASGPSPTWWPTGARTSWSAARPSSPGGGP